MADGYQQQRQDRAALIDFYSKRLGPNLSGFLDTVANRPMELDVAKLAAQSGMSEDEVRAFAAIMRQQAGHKGVGFFGETTGWLDTLNKGRERLSALDAQTLEEQNAAKYRQDITGQIQAFIDNLRGPLNNDPVYQQIAKQAINAAQAQAGRAGMSGRSGLAATNAAAVTQTTSAPYYAARQQALAGGLALQNQRDLGLGQLQAQKAALEAGLAKDTWAAQQNAAQGVGAAIGGGIGALGFIGSPALGAATMGAGAAIGGGLGGMVAAPTAPNFSSSMGRPSSRPGVNPYTGY